MVMTDDIRGVRVLGALLGRGSRGAVYAATLDDGTEVALKVRSLAGAGSWQTLARFERSARLLAALSHPSFPRVHAFEPMGVDGRALLVLERIAVGTLRDRLAERGDRLDEASLRALLRGLLDALANLHAQSPALVHRDVAPHHVGFRDDTYARPVLLDCDELTTLDDVEEDEPIVGTPGFLAPEQIAGRATCASDVYSAAATVVFAATRIDVDGHPRRRGRVDLGATVSPDLRALLAAMLETDPDARPSALEALAMLDGAPVRAERRGSRLRTAATVALAITWIGAVPWERVEPHRATPGDAAPGDGCRIASAPPGATIYLGDRDVAWSEEHPLTETLGVTPRTVPRAPGRPLVLHKRGYRPFVVELPGTNDAPCVFTADLVSE